MFTLLTGCWGWKSEPLSLKKCLPTWEAMTKSCGSYKLQGSADKVLIKSKDNSWESHEEVTRMSWESHEKVMS